ncbi:hypothetical protein EPIR_0493 [Erwinia piriflorinigrans CFBP 5888]|uniref:Uncharacterized protein n=1 Tax=Erwinia piriflorinigrans CFBP 5888 TaxID=1161919 RepID=V5Z4G8_9GAMM|nr:hypothetical protein EPIR_0493 [Erwinia piriflorinigrans CFBP 5888]
MRCSQKALTEMIIDSELIGKMHDIKSACYFSQNATLFFGNVRRHVFLYLYPDHIVITGR